ncbi:MAG: RHS repeat-associated core domain-containing protein [Streptosporangiaceae bacterium]
MSLDGRNTTLVDDPSTGWHAQGDINERIQFKTGTVNGTSAGDYWVVTDPGGTSYYFGLNRLPGWASGDASTNSAWTVPVYATASGQPCYSSTFSSSKCNQAWRWNLDYVTDPHGNAMAYYYTTETNSYAADNGTTATASYIRGGALQKIAYGLRDGAVYGVTPAGEVDFTTAATRTDVPTSSGTGDLECSSEASCDVQSPTFWSKLQLTTIATRALDGTTQKPADTWALAQTFPATGDGSAHPPMWLSTITQTGDDGSPTVPLPPVTFTPTPNGLPNRVETQADLNDGYSIIARMRMFKVTSPTGGITTVSYDTPPSACTSGSFPAEDADHTVCYPDWWTPPGSSSPTLDWFNKYVVTAVTQSNTAGGTTPVTTSYCYGTSPDCLNGAAWHYDDDPLLRKSKRTWDQWHGFGTVTTTNGTSPDPVTKTVDTFFQGMDGDYQSSGTTESHSLSDSHGDTVTDSPQFAGMNFEHLVYNGSSVVTDTATIPYSSAATATQPQPSPLPALQSFMTNTKETRTFTTLASGGSRESDITNAFDSAGRITSTSNVPDTSQPSEDTCTTTSYAPNTSTWLLDLPAEVQTVSVPCGTAPTLPADAVSDTRYFYDGSATLGAAPTHGDVTKTQLATSYSGSSPVLTTQSSGTFDEYGRVLTATDADNRTTTTSYTPATGAEPTSVTVIDPKNLGSGQVTTYDPVTDLPLTETSAAGYVTSETYDALGRITAVWSPGHPQGTVPADKTFSYKVSATDPSMITTNTITPSGGYNPSEVLYDSLGRQIETQTQTPDGGRQVSDITYDSDGWKLVTSDPYYTAGAPQAKLVAATDDQVPSQTGYFYDGAGRVLRQVSYKFAAETWETDTAYGGNYTTVTPPDGATPKTTYTDGRSLTTDIYQYHSSPPPSAPPTPGTGNQTGSGGWDHTSYTYTPARQLASVTGPAGNNWTYHYDLSGNRTTVTAPDTGTTTSTYDPAGQLMLVTDARGRQVSFTYDLDGRKTAEYDTTGGAQQSGATELAAWTYDRLKAGLPTASIAYVGGTSGTSYTQATTGYNSYGLPSGSSTAISGGPLAGTYKRGFTYNAYGNLQTSYFDPALDGLPAETVSTGYDTSNEPVSVGSSLWTYVAALSYTELGQPHEYAFGTSTEPVSLTNTYDQQTGRLTAALVQAGVSPVTLDSTAYTYDNAGNITSAADTPPGGTATANVQCFQYDYLARLVQAWAQGTAGCASTPSQSAEGGAAPYWNSYTYDTASAPGQNNLQSETSTPPTGSAVTTTYAYNAPGSAQPHAVQTATPAGGATTNYSYDLSGNTTRIAAPSGTQNLNWNAAGQLTSITNGSGTVASYAYDASGNLLVQTDGATTTLYLPDTQITDSGGTISAVRYYTIGGITAAARTSAGQVEYLTGNQQGTATLAVDSATLTATHRYYDPNGQPVGPARGSWPGNKGFVNGTTDPVTGLDNLGAREYNPATTTFLSTDSIQTPYNPQDLNPYAYAYANPATDQDPAGTMPCDGEGHCGSFQALERIDSQPTYAWPVMFDRNFSLASYAMPPLLVPPVLPPVPTPVREIQPHITSRAGPAPSSTCGFMSQAMCQILSPRNIARMAFKNINSPGNDISVPSQYVNPDYVGAWDSGNSYAENRTQIDLRSWLLLYHMTDSQCNQYTLSGCPGYVNKKFIGEWQKANYAWSSCNSDPCQYTAQPDGYGPDLLLPEQVPPYDPWSAVRIVVIAVGEVLCGAATDGACFGGLLDGGFVDIAGFAHDVVEGANYGIEHSH